MTQAVTAHGRATLDRGPEPRARWTGRTRGGRVGNRIFVWLVRHAGVRSAYVLLVPVALYYVLFAPAAVGASWDYQRRVRPKASWLNRLLGVYRHFFSFGQILLDRIAIISGPSQSGRFEFRCSGEEHIQNALKEGRGIVLVSAHCGNWEAAAHALQRFGAPVNVVAYEGEEAARGLRLAERRYFDKVLQQRSFAIIAADQSAETSLAIMTALARGEIVAMHGDRALGAQQETLEFLGSPARFSSGAHTVAAISGAALIYAFAVRVGAFRYQVDVRPADRLTVAPGPAPQHVLRGREALRDWMAGYVRQLEEVVRAHPFQWHNFYRFWQ